ncbi:MAG: hypothetical protein UX38_C0009G0001, partial [Microgenomates group bacterium GW2011_GWC1_46_16]
VFEQVVHDLVVILSYTDLYHYNNKAD